MVDVAARAGVSQSTVSFVLNGLDDKRISETTRARVLEAARALGYRHRSAERSTPPGTEGVIGLLVDEIATSVYASMSIEAAQEAAWRHGLLLEVAMSGGDPAYERAALERWSDASVRGVIYASILTRRVSPPDTLSAQRAVLLNCHEDAARFPAVVPAERRGGEAATRALIEADHQRIGFITGETWMEASAQRQEGYERALREAGRAVDPELIAIGNFLPTGGYDATRALMSRANPPDAIFCANDLMAIGCYDALRSIGERPGETVAVIGYDDQDLAQYLRPRLSTVLLPHREMGRWCVQALLSEPDAPPSTPYRIECPLVPRESHRVRRARRAASTRRRRPRSAG